MNTAQTEMPSQSQILPEDPVKATYDLIAMSRGLVAIAEREQQALAQNDLMNLAILQDEKDSASRKYQMASEEFRGRIDAFKTVDKALIGQLESLQRNMNDIMSNNNLLVLQMRDKARQSTAETLITAQALGQEKVVTFGGRAWDTPEAPSSTQVVEQGQGA